MNTYIDLISPPVSEQIGLKELINYYFKLNLVLGYSPDRDNPDDFQRDYIDSELYQESLKIISNLKEKFFETLYIERDAKNIVKSYLPTEKVILVVGLPGVGKTVLLRKICEEVAESNLKVEYIDYKSVIGFSDVLADFEDKFSYTIKKILEEKYFTTEAENLEWVVYRVNNDPRYSSLLEFITNTKLEKPSVENWRRLVKNPQISNMLYKIPGSPSVNLLLRFLRKKYAFGLCIDNIDKCSIEEQGAILNFCIDVSNEAKIPIILAIRTYNLQRLVPYGANGDFVFDEEMEDLKPSVVKISDSDVNSSSMFSIRSLLDARIKFLHEYTLSDSFIVEYQKISHDINDDVSMINYLQEFNEAVNAINETFIQADAYSCCNHNIREILILYSELINKFLLNPEPNHFLKNILFGAKRVDKTLLRNAFYKTVIMGGAKLPNKDNLLLPNIYEESKIATAINYTLIHLSKMDGQKFTCDYDKLRILLWRVGVERANFNKALDILSEDRYFNERTLIWVDIDNEEGLYNPNTSIQLMPAGEYFIKKLSLSREYTFWMAMMTQSNHWVKEGNVSLLPQNYEETLDSKYKLDVCYEFINNYLLPKFTGEINYANNSVKIPEAYKGTSLSYFKSMLFIDNKPHLCNLIDSISRTIRHSNLNPTQKQVYQQQYGKLIEKVLDII